MATTRTTVDIDNDLLRELAVAKANRRVRTLGQAFEQAIRMWLADVRSKSDKYDSGQGATVPPTEVLGGIAHTRISTYDEKHHASAEESRWIDLFLALIRSGDPVIVEAATCNVFALSRLLEFEKKAGRTARENLPIPSFESFSRLFEQAMADAGDAQSRTHGITKKSG